MRATMTIACLLGILPVVDGVAAPAEPAAGAVTPTTRPSEPNDQSRQKAAAEKFDQGRSAFFTGDYKQAIDLLEAASAADPKKLSYLFLLARAYEFDGQAERAEAKLRQVLEQDPEHAEAGLALAKILAGRKQWTKVSEVLGPILSVRHDYEVYHLLAEAFYHQDNLKQARQHYEKAVEQNPRSASDHYQLGNIYLTEGKFALAAEAYGKAEQFGHETPALHYKLATAYFNLRNYLGRIEQRTVRGGAPGTIKDGFYLLEPVPGKQDRFFASPPASAIYQIQKAMDAGIAEPELTFLQANTWLKARRFKRALELFAKLQDVYQDETKKISKDDRALFYYYYAQASFGVDDYEGYLAHLAKAIELDKATYEARRVKAYEQVAERYNQQGDLDNYIKYLKLAVAAAPDSASLHYRLGNAYHEAKQPESAAVQWRMTLELQPDHPERLRLLGLIENPPEK